MEDIFNKELSRADIPFKELISKEPYINDLFKEFKSAEKKPCFSLYLNEFYNDEELEQGFVEIREQIPTSEKPAQNRLIAASFIRTTPFESNVNKLHSDFLQKAMSGTLEEKYYCPDLAKTNIITTLRKIDKTFTIFQQSLLHGCPDHHKEVEIRAESIITSINGLNSKDLSNELLEQMIGDNFNFYLDDGTSREWDAMKDHFNLVLSKFFEDQGLKKPGAMHNEFNGEPLDNVRDHFSQLCRTVSKKNQRPFLTPQQLEDFISRAFCGSDFSKITMNKGNRDGISIQKIFYSYWCKCKELNVYQSVNRNHQHDYLRLLTENFIGFEFDKLKGNFHHAK